MELEKACKESCKLIEQNHNGQGLCKGHSYVNLIAFRKSLVNICNYQLQARCERVFIDSAGTLKGRSNCSTCFKVRMTNNDTLCQLSP